MLAAALLLQAAVPPAGSCSVRTVREPTRTFSGLWVDAFEDTRFVDGGTKREDLDWRAPRISIAVGQDVAMRMRDGNRADDYRIYRVTFRGYRAKHEVPGGCRPPPNLTGASYTVESVISSFDLGPIPH